MTNAAEDPDLKSEIASALDGIHLQELDLPTSRRVAVGERPGRVQPGTVLGIHGEDVIVELGPLLQGVADVSEFPERPTVGQVYEFVQRGEKDGLILLSRGDAVVLSTWRELARGKLVEGKVTAVNTGGLELRIGPVTAFLPASHLDLRRVDDLSGYLNQTLVCEVLEVEPDRKRVLVSRRIVLERERARAREESLSALRVGQLVRGKITRLESFGAFVEIAPGLEGLLHVSNISRRRVEKPEELLTAGETVECLILSMEDGGKRIGLGRKQLEPNPWDNLAARLPIGTVLSGRVTRVMDFGAFVEIEPGIEGLVHVSQLARERVRRPTDAVRPGDTISVRVLGIEPPRERLSLSRLDSSGVVLGSEDAGDTESLSAELERGRSTNIGTNLGDLLRRAKGR